MPTWENLLSSNVVLTDAVRRIADLPPEAQIDFEPYPRDEWIDVVRDNLTARALRRTSLINVSYLSKSPEAARAVVDAVVVSYLDFMDKNHRDTSVEVVSILDKERKTIEQKLLAKQRELLQVKHRVRDLGLREGSLVTHPVVQRVVELNNTWMSVRKQRVGLEASLAAIHAADRQRADMRQFLLKVEPLVGRQVIMSGLGIAPESVEQVNAVERKLFEDQAELEVMLDHYGDQHPDTLRLRQTIGRAQAYLGASQQTIRERSETIQRNELAPMLISMVDQQLRAAKLHEAELAEEYMLAEAEAVQMNDRLAELQIVQDETDRLKGFHKNLLNKITVVDIDQDRADVRIAVVSEPTASDKPVSPRIAMVVFLCLVAGLGSGAAVVYVSDLLDDRFRSPEEMQDQLGKPVLAMVRTLPEMEQEDARYLPAYVAPQAVESEAFRTLRTTLAFSGDELERVAITSCEPGDGKTTLLANLGVTSAQAGKKTLLIDCDLRRPGLSRILGLRGAEGVSQVLRSSQDLPSICREVIKPTSIVNLDVLPSGGRSMEPSELLSSQRMVDLLAWAENEYDQVLVDCPPIMAASDAAIVGRLVDGMLLVVQPSKNGRRVVLRASDELTRMKVNLIGVVVNRVETEGQNGGHGFASGFSSGYGYGLGYEDDDHDDADAFIVDIASAGRDREETQRDEQAAVGRISPRRRAA
jgi:capsular exopolysaccharide synthesis family protein